MKTIFLIRHHSSTWHPVNLLTGLAMALLLCCCSTLTIAQSDDAEDTTSTSHLDLSSNECLKKLDDNDIVIASIAFTDGLNSAEQLKELLKRKPWGVGTPATADEIKTQLEVQSPFLIITLTKEQVLTLDDHRDIIRWVLVQSTTTTCS